MEPWMIAVGAGLLFFVVGAVGLYNSIDAKTKRQLRKLVRTPIKDVRDASVARVVGRLKFLDVPLTAPLSGRKCAYYSVVVEEYRGGGRSGRWVEIIREEKAQDFLLSDGTGHALVHMTGATVAITRDASFTSGTFHDATEVLEAFLNKHGMKSKGWVLNKGLRYTEGVLEIGEDIAVGGFSKREPDPDPSAVGDVYRESPMRLVFSASVESALLVSDASEAAR
jgi:hypothetical protein